MARHADATGAQAQALEVSQEEQKQLLESMSGMARKAIKKVFENLVATKLCYMCLGRPGTDTLPLKVDENGKCVNCLGAGRVADFERNRWAVNEILARKIPMPKAIEMRVEDKSDRAALAKIFAGMPKAQVMEMERIWSAQLERVAKAVPVAVEAEVVDDPAQRPD